MRNSRKTNLVVYAIFTAPALIGIGLLFVAFGLIENWGVARIVWLILGIVLILGSATLIVIGIRNTVQPKPVEHRKFELSVDAKHDNEELEIDQHDYELSPEERTEAFNQAIMQVTSDAPSARTPPAPDPVKADYADRSLKERAIRTVLDAIDPDQMKVLSQAVADGVPVDSIPSEETKTTLRFRRLFGVMSVAIVSLIIYAIIEQLGASLPYGNVYWLAGVVTLAVLVVIGLPSVDKYTRKQPHFNLPSSGKSYCFIIKWEEQEPPSRLIYFRRKWKSVFTIVRLDNARCVKKRLFMKAHYWPRYGDSVIEYCFRKPFMVTKLSISSTLIYIVLSAALIFLSVTPLLPAFNLAEYTLYVVGWFVLGVPILYALDYPRRTRYRLLTDVILGEEHEPPPGFTVDPHPFQLHTLQNPKVKEPWWARPFNIGILTVSVVAEDTRDERIEKLWVKYPRDLEGRLARAISQARRGSVRHIT